MGAPPAGPAPRPPEVPLDSRLGRTILVTVILGSSVAMLTATVVNVALPVIGTDLDAGSAGQKWILNGYMLTLASLILVGGDLGDRFGRVRVYRWGVTWFAVASLLCAVAWSTESLIVFRLLQGVGGALLTPGSLAIIEATLRREDRGRGIGAWSGITGVASAVGPLVGGLLVELSWRWVFVLNLPLAVVAVIASTRIPETSDPDAADTRVDVTGAVLTVLTLGCSSYALIEGPEGGWSPIEIGAIVVAAAAFVLLLLDQRRRPNALIPIDLFGVRRFVAANLLTFLIYGAMSVMFFLLPVQLQVTAGWSPVAAGFTLLPVTVIMLLLSPRMGELATRIGPRWLLSIGPVVMAVGILLLTRVGPDAEFLPDVLPGVVVFALGLSAIVAPVTAAALDSVPQNRAGVASGVNNAVARSGALLGVAAIPAVVGLTGDALRDAELLDQGFGEALVVVAAIEIVAGLSAWWMLGPRDAPTPDHAVVEPELATRCPLDGPVGADVAARR